MIATFKTKAELERERLIKTARDTYESIFPTERELMSDKEVRDITERADRAINTLLERNAELGQGAALLNAQRDALWEMNDALEKRNAQLVATLDEILVECDEASVDDNILAATIQRIARGAFK